MLFLSPVKGGVDAKELFHLYILLWIQDKRLSLLESCKLDKVHILSPGSFMLFSPYIFQFFWVFFAQVLGWKQQNNCIWWVGGQGEFIAPQQHHVEGLCSCLILRKFSNLQCYCASQDVLRYLCLQVKWSGVRTQHSTTPFVDDMYDRLKETLSHYEIIICRWPEYIFGLENVRPDGFSFLSILFLFVL